MRINVHAVIFFIRLSIIHAHFEILNHTLLGDFSFIDLKAHNKHISKELSAFEHTYEKTSSNILEFNIVAKLL